MKPGKKPVITPHREFPCIESTLDFITPDGFKVRVWRDEVYLKATYDNDDIFAAVMSKSGTTADAIIRTLAKMPRVNAIQVQEPHRESGTLRGFQATGLRAGVVVYTVWP